MLIIFTLCVLVAACCLIVGGLLWMWRDGRPTPADAWWSLWLQRRNADWQRALAAADDPDRDERPGPCRQPSRELAEPDDEDEPGEELPAAPAPAAPVDEPAQEAVAAPAVLLDPHLRVPVTVRHTRTEAPDPLLGRGRVPAWLFDTGAWRSLPRSQPDPGTDYTAQVLAAVPAATELPGDQVVELDLRARMEVCARYVEHAARHSAAEPETVATVRAAS